MKSSIFLLLFLFSGCGNAYYSVPVQPDVIEENEYFKATLKPTNPSMIAGYTAFILDINNQTDKDLEIDWNKTYFIQNGQVNGSFMFDGIIYRDRNQPKSPDIIFSKSNFSKTIYPNNYVQYGNHGWIHMGTGLGQQGIYLTVNIDNKEIKQKIIVNVKEGKEQTSR
ncbi:MAG: hypothetical protein RBR54_04710 [Sulfurimonas sp.]|nr:hypothetical protein [Sulfurimonas sp.]